MTKLKTKVDFLKRGLNTSKQHDYIDFIFKNHGRYISHNDVCNALHINTQKAHNLKSQFVYKFSCVFKDDCIDGIKFFRFIDIVFDKDLKTYIVKRELEMKQKVRTISDYNYMYEPSETDILLNSVFRACGV